MYEEIKAVLAAIDGLTDAEGNQKVFPLGAAIDEVEPPLMTYSCTGPDPFRSLSGRIHHYTETFTADILAETYDDCRRIYDQGVQAIYSARIPGMLRVSCTCPEPDAFVPELNLNRKRLQISMDWR